VKFEENSSTMEDKEYEREKSRGMDGFVVMDCKKGE